MNNKKLYKSRVDNPLAGVCGGLADYLKMDANILRLIFVFLLLITGFLPCIILYVIAALIIPFEDEAGPTDVYDPEDKSQD